MATRNLSFSFPSSSETIMVLEPTRIRCHIIEEAKSEGENSLRKETRPVIKISVNDITEHDVLCGRGGVSAQSHEVKSCSTPSIHARPEPRLKTYTDNTLPLPIVFTEHFEASWKQKIPSFDRFAQNSLLQITQKKLKN